MVAHLALVATPLSHKFFAAVVSCTKDGESRCASYLSHRGKKKNRFLPVLHNLISKTVCVRMQLGERCLGSLDAIDLRSGLPRMFAFEPDSEVGFKLYSEVYSKMLSK